MAYLLMLLWIFPLYSIDLGTQGHTFPIAEIDLLELLQNRLGETSEKKLALINATMEKRIRKHIESPTPVPLPYAKHDRIFSFDPTITVKSEVKDDQGKVIIAKGTKYNPLENNHSLPEAILIFDGNNPDHLRWAQKNKGVWVLTNGKPLQLEKQENRPVYFDQGGVLTKKLKISAIPAIVSQEGSILKIEELVIGSNL
jgi:conjugal transfer pilus assembly protein TraW